ncbi:hypothetical protein SASPL_113000 [Salvia splendens]|uniref:Adenylosuccinate lyase n=1 Tax=Salvia splendens TaxID=180675 RepID=A0A8X9A545_SALSN|nr:hypothetical protein SASPL_113000 [Salvia splendens]
MLKDALSKVILPYMDKLIRALCDIATSTASVSMLSRTHGQITKAGEIGSSMMPHKVNPIDFENSEGNCGIANGGLSHLSTKLPTSHMQELSLLAYKSALQGIAKLQVMRRYGVPEPYEKLKELTRGRTVTRESIREFIEGQSIPTKAKKSLLDVTPQSYTREAEELAKKLNLLRSSVNDAKRS